MDVSVEANFGSPARDRKLSASRRTVLLYGTEGRRTGTMTSTDVATGERADLLSALAKQRYFLRFTARDLTDEQSAVSRVAS